MTHQEQIANTQTQSNIPNALNNINPIDRANLAKITMDSLSAHVAIFDPSGEILAVNRAWREFASQNDGDPGQMCEGSNYLDVCQRAAETGSTSMQAFITNVQKVINQQIDHFDLEYPCHSPTERRWFIAKVTRFTYNDEMCIVVAHEDITPLKLAEEAQRKQRAFAEALLDITTLLNGTLDYEIVLERIIANLHRVIPYDRANIIMLDGDKVHILGSTDEFSMLQDINTPERLQQLIQDCDTALVYQQDDGTNGYRTYIGVPVFYGEQFIGVINLEKDGQAELDALHMERLRAFAAQAAIAIQNARLHQQAQQVAVLEERQRLARDLHDSVSQTLFSADLIAQTLPRLWEVNKQKAQHVAEELHELTGGALAEMRTLLMELRPSALVQASLPELISQLARAFNGRTRIPIDIDIDNSISAPYKAKIAFYRITQEALSNIQQHANANQVRIILTQDERTLTLHIIDDGIGFPQKTDNHEHHGLAIMQERAAQINATLEFTSQQPGTTISLYWIITQG